MDTVPNVRGRADPVNGGGDTNELKIYTFARTLAHALVCVWSRRMPDSLRVVVVWLAPFERPPGAGERGAEGGNGSSNADAKLLCRTANTKKKKMCNENKYRYEYFLV